MLTPPLFFYQDPLEAEAVMTTKDFQEMVRFSGRTVLIHGVLWDFKKQDINPNSCRVYLEHSRTYNRLR